MKKLMIIVTMIFLTGCAFDTGFDRFNKASIRGQDVYKGMPFQKLDSLLGSPDRSEYMGNGFMVSYYDDYLITMNQSTVTDISRVRK